MWDGFDNRKFPRMNLSCEIKVKCAEDGALIKSKTENIGVGGVAVVLDKSLERFSTCDVRLKVSADQDEISCEGKVMWIVPMKDMHGRKTRYDVGIEFIDLSDDAREAIRAAIEDFSKSEQA